MLRLGILLTLALTAGSASAGPKILIAGVKGKGDGDVDTQIANYMAQALDSHGRVISIVYGLTDPTFRQLVQDGKIKVAPDVPKLEDLGKIAGQIGADYVFSYTSSMKGTKIVAKGELRKSGRKIWNHEETLSVQLSNGYADSDTAESIARTWTLMLEAGPFKDLASAPKAPTPDLQPGQTPVKTDPIPVAPTPKKAADNSQLRKDLEKLVASGEVSRAVAMARDAIDAQPSDLERRTLLIQVLQSAGQNEAAAKEARRAADLMPDKPELRSIAARAWLAAGKPDEARADMNEAVARDPDSAPTRLMLAQISLLQLQPERALEHLERAIKSQPSTDAYVMRALCRTLLGGADGAKLDLDAGAKLTPEPAPGDVIRRYEFSMGIMDSVTEKVGADVRALMQRSLQKGESKAVRELLDNQSRLVKARVDFLTMFGPPPSHAKSHEVRLLAQRLLTESFTGIDAYLKSGSEDDMTEARINLGEALKQQKSAQEAYAAERVGPKNERPIKS